MPASPDTTRLLLDLRKGDGSARDALLTLVHDEPRDLAARHMLKERHPRVVERRFLGISIDTVSDDWPAARTWLRRRLGEHENP